MRKNLEKEIKLQVVSGNVQIKLFGENVIDNLSKKIFKFFEMTGIHLSQPKRINIIDEYYDDRNHSALMAKWGIRYRQENSTRIITIKEPKGFKLDESLERVEYEKTITGSIRNQEKIDHLKEMIRSIKHRFKFDTDTLKCNLVIHNERKTFLLTDKIEVSFDNYFFEDPYETKTVSEPRYQIEIEFEECSVANKKIGKIIKGLKEIFDLGAVKESKYHEGMEWKKSVIKSERVYCICYDIVNYTANSALEQRKMVKILTELTQSTAQELGIHNEQIRYIPVGDAIIMLFRQPLYSLIVRFLKNLNNKLNTRRNGKIILRTGVHFSGVVSYTDITGKENWAGDGINTAWRIMTSAKPGRILFSEQSHCELIQYDNKEFQKKFGKLRQWVTKNGQKIQAREMISCAINAKY